MIGNTFECFMNETSLTLLTQIQTTNEKLNQAASSPLQHLFSYNL